MNTVMCVRNLRFIDRLLLSKRHRINTEISNALTSFLDQLRLLHFNMYFQHFFISIAINLFQIEYLTLVIILSQAPYLEIIINDSAGFVRRFLHTTRSENSAGGQYPRAICARHVRAHFNELI